jgi:hypothetical protein
VRGLAGCAVTRDVTRSGAGEGLVGALPLAECRTLTLLRPVSSTRRRRSIDDQTIALTAALAAWDTFAQAGSSTRLAGGGQFFFHYLSFHCRHAVRERCASFIMAVAGIVRLQSGRDPNGNSWEDLPALKLKK